MRTRKWVGVLLGAAMTFGMGLALAQDSRRPGGRQTPGGTGGPGARVDVEQMRQQWHQRRLDSIREALQATEEEWKALQPRIEKVMSLSRDTLISGGGGFFMRRGGRTSETATTTEAQSPVAKALQELQTTLENKDSTPEQIKAKLTALREAREKAKQELAKAREAVRELVTQRQEAQLVLMGILD